MNKFIITTSWDDGHALNLKLLELLNKYNLKATFYIQAKYIEEQTGQDEILKIAQTQEIGAHTFSHSNLTQLKPEQVKQEINLSKKKLEDLLARPAKMFAYPFGAFNPNIKQAVKQAGFLGSRTVQNFIFNQPDDTFKFGTSLHVYPHPLRKRDAEHLHGPKVVLQPLQKNYKAILKFKLPFNSFFNWLNLAKNLFDYAYQHGQLFHLWGHAWEIEKYNMWQELEQFFQYIKKHSNCVYLNNQQVLNINYAN